MIRLIACLLAGQFAFSALAAEDTTLLTRKQPNGAPLTAGPDDANIARVTARILERYHYLRQPFNDEISSKFLDRYIDALDNLRMYFLQSDIIEFERYRHRLDDLILKDGNTDPGRLMFNRFLQRLGQQNDYVTNLLHTEKFAYTADEKYLVNRKDQPRPKDLAEAKQLWRDRLRYEYLQEKLGIGRPDEIGKVIHEKLKEGKAGILQAAIEEKMSKEKAKEIVELIQTKVKTDSPEKIVETVVAKLEKDNAEEIVKILTRRYARLLRSLQDFDSDDVLQLYLTALSHVYDPHSDYMGRSELENFSIGMKLSLFGIGALLRSEDGYCKIQSLTPNGPAEKSKKLKPNDKIIAVAQGDGTAVDVVDMKLNKVVEMIRGQKGTEVRLTVVPADAPDPSARKIISLVRDEIKLEDQEAKAKLIEMPLEKNRTVRMGVIDLPSFYSTFELEGKRGDSEPKSTTLDVARLIRKLVQEKASGIVLDLRRNGGGSLEEAIRLSGLFIKEGPIVQVKGPDGDPIIEKDPDPSVFYDGPLVVLTSRFSASASEILAGALQDYGRAIVVGDSSTHGKGTVQSLLQLSTFMRGGPMGLSTSNNPGALKVTIRKFYRASGASTQLKGVTPDIVLPSIYNHAEVGEASLDNPLPWDTIAPASYDKMNRIDSLLPELRRRSDSRLGSDPDFAFLREEIERFKKNQAEKSISLNESQRLKEKQDAADRAKARKKELAARPEPPGKTYEITLKNSEMAGLPDPMTKTNGVKTAEAKAATTNAPAQVATAEGDDADETIPDDKVSNVDMALEEAKRILIDYLTLIRGNSLAGTTGGGIN